MTPLLPCRWRVVQNDGSLMCLSEKYVAAPNRVREDFCRTCCFREAQRAGCSGGEEIDLRAPEVAKLLASKPSAAAKQPPIFCITCVQTPERTAKATQHFLERGLEVQFFPGIHASTFGLRTVLTARKNYQMPAGHVGLVLSHYMLWQTLAFLPYEEILILEDDAYFEPDFLERFWRAYADLPPDWHFVFVGGVALGGKAIEPITRHIGIIRYPCGTHAYLVKRSILPFLLQTNHQARNHIDLQLIENSLPRLNCYTFTPSLVKQRGQVAPADGTGENWPTMTSVPDK
jgi:GR25 family glycosyltransferase involved in LPS biosynthesis